MATEEDAKQQPLNEYVTGFPDNPLLDRAYGCCIGAAIGDSLGSFLEFRKKGITKEEVDQAMTMPGGGTWGPRVVSGQVTDDTELALSLAYGLVDCIHKTPLMKRQKSDAADLDADEKQQNPKMNAEYAPFDLSKIAKEYQRWIASHPFDIGICTSKTLRKAPKVRDMKTAASEYNAQKSQSNHSGKAQLLKGNMANGSLMRCMPLCLYGYKLSIDNLYKIMREESSLTHAHFGVYLVNTAYSIMVQSLLTANANNKKRNIEAFQLMRKWLESQTTPKKRSKFERSPTKAEQEAEELKCEAATEILKVWLEYLTVSDVCGSNDDANEVLTQLHPATLRQGFVQIAFQRACFHLLRGSTFEEAMRSVVGEGGDTDTNACIVGGLLGAYHGLNSIPKEMVIKIHECQCKERDMFQAKWYFVDQIPSLLIENAPTDSNFTWIQEY